MESKTPWSHYHHHFTNVTHKITVLKVSLPFAHDYCFLSPPISRHSRLATLRKPLRWALFGWSRSVCSFVALRTLASSNLCWIYGKWFKVKERKRSLKISNDSLDILQVSIAPVYAVRWYVEGIAQDCAGRWCRETRSWGWDLAITIALNLRLLLLALLNVAFEVCDSLTKPIDCEIVNS